MYKKDLWMVKSKKIDLLLLLPTTAIKFYFSIHLIEIKKLVLQFTNHFSYYFSLIII